MSEGRDGLPFSDAEPKVPASLWADSQPMTLADLAAAYERLRDPPPTWRERPVVLVSPQEARAIESTLQAITARINGSPVLTIPIGERVDGGADFAEEPDQQMFTAIESTFATTLPRLEPLWIRDGVSNVGEPMKIDTSAAPAPRQDPSVVGQWTVTREPPSGIDWTVKTTPMVTRGMERVTRGRSLPHPYAVASLARYVPGDDRDMHMSDYLRTRVRPGANPRRGWAMRVDERDARASMVPVYEVGKPDGLHAFYNNTGYTIANAGYLPDQARYVPHDVCRWRNPAHRAELTRRAREYADCAQRLVDR